MAFPEDFSEALSEIDTDPDLFNQVFSWNGDDYACIATGDNTGGSLESFGWAVSQGLTIIARVAQFTKHGLPLGGQAITYRGLQRQIDSVTIAPGNSFVRLNCVSKNRGA